MSLALCVTFFLEYVFKNGVMSLLGGVWSGSDEFGKLDGSFGSGKIGIEFVGSYGIEA